MGQFASLPTDDVIALVLPAGSALGEVADEMAGAHTAAWGAVDPVLLDLCRLRTAMLLGCEAELVSRHNADRADAIAQWPTDPRFDSRDRAALAFTEQYLIDVASLDDALASELRGHLGDEGLQNFVSALMVCEQRIRLRLMWNRLAVNQHPEGAS
jgi:alkylhydroperoxidase family enzyme